MSPRTRSVPRLAAASAGVLAAGLCLTACGEGAQGGDGSSVKVGLITKTDTNPFFVKMRQGAERAAKTHDVQLSTAAGKFDGDNAGQVTAIENMVAAGVKGILITPNDSKAIVPALERARARGVLVVALDSPTDPEDATDALFATDNRKAGELIGKYAKSAMKGRKAKIATLDLAPGVAVGIQRHQGFLKGFGVPEKDPSVVCSQDTGGDQAKGQTAMENCLQKAPSLNLVYAINEPAALGAWTALKAKGREKDVMIVTVDGGCTGTRAVKDGKLAATSQQYPLKMAEQGVAAVAKFAEDGKKPSGYTDTGVTLVTDEPQSGDGSRDTAFGLKNCWG
ncbi:sugar ABC transporter substrate-binding protein [Streptomyces albus]|uniref:Sugar ABC transporter substrate-binding protein n=1 Tax=Streptomyces albus (strain ATCC 21838 / DSM 41398 / FERM P-419 / JCM 4703 / NBRC 107858) TaxID=1081613 RepID=A0A0B5EIM7_STRA4|nr:sugar ABC transporter substrate-binding protein [Streptomyces albus]AOU76424.1 sugar ABC transporter substrate-binding protein [Streptomyces albus]AYN32210.1 sugar ABC transporter substrate-binding protein [Streptomyces albus]